MYTLCNSKNGILSNDIIVLRNNEEYQNVVEERHGGGEGQQGRPNLSWRPITYQVRVQLEVQEQLALKSSSMSYTDSIFLRCIYR
jgi:hypothetical protein